MFYYFTGQNLEEKEHSRDRNSKQSLNIYI